MITKENKLRLEHLFPTILKNSTHAVQKIILSRHKELVNCIIYISMSELMIQQYEGLWLHCCHIPGRIWRESWETASRYMDDPANWMTSLYQCDMIRIRKAINKWRKMPDGNEKDQFLDRFVRDNCVDLAIIGARFSCNTGEHVPNDMLKEIKRLGFTT